LAYYEIGKNTYLQYVVRHAYLRYAIGSDKGVD